MLKTHVAIGLGLLATACGAGAGGKPAASAPMIAGPRFADDLAFLRQHTNVILLHDAAGRAQVVVAPEYQGRVMTSATSADGASFGFIKRANVESKARQPHINVPGGEDRFWVGPEGGQYGLYFAPGAPFDLEQWQVPEPIDWGAWQVSASSANEVRVQRDMQLQNHAGTQFTAHVDRAVRVLEREAIAEALGAQLPDELTCVGYASENVLSNRGQEAWTKDKGLLSIWILGMFNPSPKTTIVIPIKQGSESELGPIVNDAYFGKVPPDRLKVGDGVVFFRGDGKERRKIGVSKQRALPVVGAYDAQSQALTLVHYTLPDDATDYVNSMWEQQAQPYAGDVLNSYNDGPPGPGKPLLGPFFELETSSPAAALAPGESIQHVSTTLHVVGPRAALDALAKQVLGVGLDAIEAAFPDAK